MAEVWIYHDKLDTYSQVPESAVGQHAMSGWVQQDPPPPGPEEEIEQVAFPEGVTAAEVLDEQPPPSRRAVKRAEAATEGDEK